MLPIWRSHKTVRADKIVEVTRPPGDNQPYAFRLQRGETVHADHAWCLKHCVWRPSPDGSPSDWPMAVGGYYVQYDDGYTSWSPAKAFEDGYTQTGEI